MKLLIMQFLYFLIASSFLVPNAVQKRS